MLFVVLPKQAENQRLCIFVLFFARTLFGGTGKNHCTNYYLKLVLK